MKTLTSKRNLLARVFSLAMVVCLLACLLVPIGASAANDAVNAARAGVLQVQLWYDNDVGNDEPVNQGSGFLVNDNTLITAYHCVSLEEGDAAEWAAYFGKTVQQFTDRLYVQVTVSRDVRINARVRTHSAEMDFAVLTLETSLVGRTPLTVRSSATVQQTEEVFAIGFPDISDDIQTFNTYTSDDATITQGVVNKVGVGANLSSWANTNFIQTSCNLDYGNSGGPMVDENGYVIGVCQGYIADSATQYYYAVAIDQITEVLDALGIVYPKANEGPKPTEPKPTEPEVETTEATVAPTVKPTEPAPTTPPATLPPVTSDKDTGSEGGMNMGLIIGIAAAVVAVIVIVVVVILLSGKKGGNNNQMPSGGFTPPAPPMPPVPPAPPAPPVGGGFTAPISGAGETTVLSQGAGETTVLARNVNGGSLIRKRTGETISINAEQFLIGRERKSVNYCISDNSSISRTHVKLVVRNGVTYLTDMNAANGTFVNGSKVLPRQEIALKPGDKITLADEDLEYKN